MTDSDKVNDGVDEGEIPVGQAAVRRHFQNMGMAFEGLLSMMAAEAQAGRFIYSMQVRWPAKDNPGFLTIVKAYVDGGPEIAFHNSAQLVGAVTGIHERRLAGQLEWRQDDWPRDEWVEELAFRHKQQIYLK